MVKPKNHSKTVIRLAGAAPAPRARQFLQHYFALERPNTTHLFFTKGLIDFFLGLVIGILTGLIIAGMTS